MLEPTDEDDDSNHQPNGSARLRAALQQARRSLSNSTSQRRMTAELRQRFPFASYSVAGAASRASLPSRRQASKRKKLVPWKVLPCCVDGPSCVKVPTRSALDKLCKVGLGVLWFTREETLNIPTYLTAEELHFLIICLYPLLHNRAYEFCKAVGPGNNIIIPLPKDDRHSTNHRFIPVCTPDQLKRLIGRKGKLYIRPLQHIDISTLPVLPEHVVYAPKSHIKCIHCSAEILLSDVPDHRYLCDGVPEDGGRSLQGHTESSEQRAESSDSGGEEGTGGGEEGTEDGMERTEANMSPVLFSDGEDTADVSQPSTSGLNSPNTRGPRRSLRLALGRTTPRTTIFQQVRNSPNNAPIAIESDSSLEELPVVEEINERPRDTISAQNTEYNEALRRDQEEDERAFFQQQEVEERSREEVVRGLYQQDDAIRIQEWHKRIRRDLFLSLPPEPAEGLTERISIRLRLPDGTHVTRCFLRSTMIQVLFNFVGSLDPVNPRSFRLLVNDFPKPKELKRENFKKKFIDLGFGLYTLVVVENVPAELSGDASLPSPLPSVPDSSIVPGPSTSAPGPSTSASAHQIDIPTSPVQIQSSSSNSSSDTASRVKVKASIRTLKEFDSKRHAIRKTFKEIVRLEVDRHDLFNAVMNKYEDFVPCEAELRVKFVNEKGVGPGVCREFFSSFWEAVQNKFEGSSAKIPVVTPTNFSSYFNLGRILSHGYVLTGYLPLFFAKAFFLSILPCVQVVDTDFILESFLQYIDDSEAAAVRVCMGADAHDEMVEFQNIVLPMLYRFKYHSVPTISSLKDALLKVASFTCISQPHYAACEMKRGLLASHPQLWKNCSKQVILQAYSILIPTPQRVLNMVKEPQFDRASQHSLFDFLRRFILSLKEEDLSKFLRFVTGKPHCSLQPIKITYHSSTNEYSRRPTAHTCSQILSLPYSYSSGTFSTFSKEFQGILDNSQFWNFDSV